MELMCVIVKLHLIRVSYCICLLELLLLIWSSWSNGALASHVCQDVSMWVLRSCFKSITLWARSKIVNIIVTLSDSPTSRILIYFWKHSCTLRCLFALYILVVVYNLFFVGHLWTLELWKVINHRSYGCYSIFSFKIYFGIVRSVTLIRLTSLLLLSHYLVLGELLWNYLCIFTLLKSLVFILQFYCNFILFIGLLW